MSMDDVLRGSSGRWVRSGNRVILLPGGTGGEEGETGFFRLGRPASIALPGARPALTQCDYIHPNIDVSAQYALYDMLRGDAAAADASAQMLAAVRNGRLAGIYQEDQRVPALHARDRLGTGWWKLVDRFRPGHGAAAVTAPAGTVPMLVFRKSVAGDRPRLGRELQGAFGGSGVARQPGPVPTGRPCTRAAPQGPKPGPFKELCVAPRSLQFHDRLSRLPITLHNCGAPGPLKWKATTTEPWLHLENTSGVVTSKPSQVIAWVDTESNVPRRSDRGGIEFTTNDVFTSSVWVYVTYNSAM